MKESQLVEKFFKEIKHLRGEGVHIYAIKLHGGIWTSGQPDVIGSYWGDGLTHPFPFAIEFKVGRNKVTKRQEQALYEWNRAGVRAYVAYSLEEAFEGIGLKYHTEPVKTGENRRVNTHAGAGVPERF